MASAVQRSDRSAASLQRSMADPRVPSALLLLVVAGGLVSCGGSDESTTATSDSAGCPPGSEPQPKDVELRAAEHVLRPGERATATVATTCGDFVIELDTKRSPKTSNSFAFMAEQGVYDDTTFQRIVPGLLIQGGDPTQSGNG